MYYLTIKLPPECHQMTLDELLFGGEAVLRKIQDEGKRKITTTRTYELTRVSPRIRSRVDASCLYTKLREFNEKYAELANKPRKSLYREFHIPKKSGGLRKIDAPCDELKEALRELKGIFEDDFRALYHTSAYAYIGNRSTIDAVKKHQSNESKWFGKFDLSNFFGSVTLDYTMKMLKMIFPFCLLRNEAEGELYKALELAFLDGGLPQGTPISPMLTNLIMIPMDYHISNALREFEGQRYVYTRYADDFLVSSKYSFNCKEIEGVITGFLEKYGAPFKLNSSKTRYGSSAGRNWNLGVMLNKDNEITVGHKKKKQFQSMLYNFMAGEQSGNQWELEDVHTLNGLHSYYRMVERETIDNIIAHFNEKNGVNVLKMIGNRLRWG